MKKFYLLFLVTVGFIVPSTGQQFFSDINETSIKLNSTTNKRVIFPQKYRTTSFDISGLRAFLWSLPSENDVNRLQAPVLALPMPDGSTARFRVWESSIMEPGLAAKFPEMRTFAGQGIDDPAATIRFDYNPYFGFHAQVLSHITGRVYIDPFARGDMDHYISYFTRDNAKVSNFTCEVEMPEAERGNPAPADAAGPCRGTQLFTYRLALACTGEYATAVCAPSAPTVPATAAAMLTTVNRVTGVYETEISLRMVLVANNNNLIYLNGATDPYTNNNGSTMLGQNQTNVDAVIGTANYDIGHVVSTGGGGIAGLRVPCVASSKARGVTGLPNPVGDNFDIDYVAHEMGHQWGGNHTFNSSTGSCAGNRNASTAYEIGSGTTIQAYAGICGSDDTQPHSDPFFHTVSFDEMSNYITTGNGGNCKVATNTGNNIPQIVTMSNNGANIPISTPFTLTGTATDPDGDALTYCWEEWDLGPSTVWNGGAASTTAPLFKSRIPVASGSRTFPDMAVILAGYPANPAGTMGGLKGETLPTVARAMKFRLTVRDNKAGGGGVTTGGDGCQAGQTGIFQINTIATSGPFAVTVPNGGESWAGGSSQTITWNVVGTDAAPISVANVKITLSTDGGNTYPTTILASTANDGSEIVTVPSIPSTNCRVRIEAIGNVFFDISNANFTISTPTGSFDFTPAGPVSVACSGPSTAAITLPTVSNGGYTVPVNLTATGNPAGTTVSFAPNPVTPGNSTVVTLNGINTLAPGNYPIVVTGTSGAIIRTVTLIYTVNPGSGPSITTQPTAKQVCEGGNTTFSVTATSVNSYQWQVSTNGGGSWSNLSNTAPYSGVTTATLTVTGATIAMNGYLYRAVLTGQCGTTNSAGVALTVNALPNVAAGSSSASVCSGTTVTLTATGADTYAWSTGTTPATGPSVTATPTVTTTYTVTGTITATGCTNTATVSVTATAKPTVTLTAAPYRRLLPGLSTVVTATGSSATTTNFVYVWTYTGSGPAQVFTGNTHTVNMNNLGTYTVTAADAGNLACVSQPASITISDSASNRLFIYPSPNNGRFTVAYYNPSATATQQGITIYDSKGARVFNKVFPVTQAYQLHAIDMRRNGKGIYQVVLRDAAGKAIKTGQVMIR